ncbi:hypothetical protein A8990_107105 [Paenibacillus taihuensis]|uniref:Uncharacterized protein n=1 Tax=Paenibacillus taihuensis TaxID=1156355 RepID=A0A3D9SJ31_9BACL|nr:hypothetical protein [Paenibacillus taihuensis]REE89009.1 hypothetical protein A8990_107105 [Paenibacillus taihuensis]
MIAQIGGYWLMLGAWSFISIRSLLARKKKREAALYGVIMLMGAVLGSFCLAHKDLPGFTIPFKLLFEPIGMKLLRHS